ncbi:VOC family protein [Herbiconiux daphne]|uniref:VOC family protein n=1 Tax=Herbiconiux daphne TaxID=2970914 RepID=A0ABT2H5H3_9MICO|nr:VOC family protein [Herbiconiux daphne]MCS5735178.1 VOC family protein [Herbiconiux daphne]
MTSPGIHHTAIIVADLDASVRFYRDGIGLAVLTDRTVSGDWPALFGAPTTTLRAVFLGDPDVVDDHAGVLELNSFEPVAEPDPRSPLSPGLFLLSFFVDVEATLDRLAALGLGGAPNRVVQETPAGAITIATVHDPDGVTILLTPGSITRPRA